MFTITSNRTTTLVPGGIVNPLNSTGGVPPAKVALEPTSVILTSSTYRRSSAAMVGERLLWNRMAVLVEM